MKFLFEDARFALRTLAKNPGFSVIAVAALALGIGVNATVFTLANRVLFKSMPFDQNDRIVYLSTRNAQRENRRTGVSYPDLLDWKSQMNSVESLEGYVPDQANFSDKTGLPESYNLAAMTANALPALGVKPVLGREFQPDEDKPSAPRVAILSYGLWDRRYGKDPSVIGRSVRVNEIPTTIIGVMGADFQFPGNTDLWIPYVPGANAEKRQYRNLSVFGRMKPGVNAKAVKAELDGITQRLAAAYPVTNSGITPVVHTFGEEFNGPEINLVFSAMLGAVGFVLLIACANVANLLLGRAVGRIREISIRTALGASRWRIMRQLLVESTLLSATGGAIGWLIAIWGVRTFDAVVIPLGKPSFIDFSMDYRVFAYLVAVSIGTGVLFGLAPALRLSRLDVNTALKDGGRGSSGGARGKFLSGMLVVTEMALAVVLLVGAGLMIRSFLVLRNQTIGVDTRNVLTMRLQLPQAKYAKEDDLIAFHDRLNKQLAALPGVESIALASNLPTGGFITNPFEIEGSAPVDEKRRPSLGALVISPDYFRAMNVKPVRGRTLADSDNASAPAVILVNQRFAEKFWPNNDPIGKRLRTFQGSKADAWATVVGIVPNVNQTQNMREPDPLIYIPFRQRPQRDIAIAARTQVPPATLATAFRKAVQETDQDLPVYRLMSLEERLALNNWSWRVFGSLFALFAGIALTLAAVGLYAVIAHSVSQRTQEIGVRMALGASTHQIGRLVFTQGMTQLSIGLAIGLLASFGVTRILRRIVVGDISTTDPVSFTIAAAALAFAAALGCWIPARRATRVDPVIALRNE
jgi:predicted permease